ncbi:MAG: hypothetical protein ACKO5P_01000, partial [Nodosilinea sp.]
MAGAKRRFKQGGDRSGAEYLVFPAKTASAESAGPPRSLVEFNYNSPGSLPGTLNIPPDALPTELVLLA